jgi:hypothetical protein
MRREDRFDGKTRRWMIRTRERRRRMEGIANTNMTEKRTKKGRE